MFPRVRGCVNGENIAFGRLPSLAGTDRIDFTRRRERLRHLQVHAAMKAYSILVGANNRRGRFLRKDEGALERITAEHFPRGFTILSAKGAWYDPEAGIFRREEAKEIILKTSRARQIEAWCQAIGQALRQKEIVVTELGRSRSIMIA